MEIKMDVGLRETQSLEMKRDGGLGRIKRPNKKGLRGPKEEESTRKYRMGREGPKKGVDSFRLA